MAGPVAAQMVRLGRWDGSIEGITEISRQETDTKGAEPSHFDRLRTEERLTIRNSGGWIYHPRLATFTLSGTFGLSQDRLTVDGEQGSDNTELYGYDTFLSLLPDQPLSLNVFASRNQETVSRAFAGESNLVSEARGATLFLRRLSLPSTLSLRQERQEEQSITGTTEARRDEQRTSMKYEGQRGWVDREIYVLYEFIDDEDKIFPTLSFHSHEGQLIYGMDFGEELNRHWDSRLRYMTRTGFIPSTFASVDELLRIDHSSRLQSTYRYLFLFSKTGDTETTTHTVSSNVTHRLWDSLTTTAGVDGTRQTLKAGEKHLASVHANETYTKRLPLDGRLTIGVGGSFQYEDDRFRESETPVSGETHTAAMPIALPIALANRFVVTSSIVVTKIAIGPVPLGCLVPALPVVLAAGVDYDTRVTGDVTEIVPRACTAATPGLNPGDTITVDYRFSVAPAITFGTVAWHTDASVDYPWVRVFGSHEELRQELIAGRPDHFLTNDTSDTLGAELRYPGTRAHASLTGEVRRFRGSRISYDSLRTGMSADALLLRDLTARVTADRTVTTFTDEHRETRSLTARAGLSYLLGPVLSVDLNGGFQQLDDSLQPRQEIRDARLVVRWVFRKLEISPTLEYRDQERGDTTTREYRGLLRVIRRF